MEFTLLPMILGSVVVPLISMAFYTLLERKILGYAQMRKGPNKAGIIGLPQPLADALKLFAKEWVKPSSSNSILFSFFPIMALALNLILWLLLPLTFSLSSAPFALMFFLCVSSLNVYTTLGSGWSSNSKYALLGALRSVAQTISYEVSMALSLLVILLTLKTFAFTDSLFYSAPIAGLLFIPISIVWLITCLAETNRAPFDFAEGESELVSGFNTEYSAGNFALIFMAEYSNILFLVFCTLLILINMYTPFFMCLPALIFHGVLLASWFIWIRATLPRMRYDRLMSLTWKAFLPLTLTTLIIFLPLTIL